MGMRSGVIDQNLKVKDLEKFKAGLMAEIIEGSIDKSYLESVRFDVEKCYSDIDDGNIWVDWQDWKIQGYWYPDFCKLCVILHNLGVRGQVHLEYDDGTPYNIMFDDDGVKAEIFEPQIYKITDGGLEE